MQCRSCACKDKGCGCPRVLSVRVPYEMGGTVRPASHSTVRCPPDGATSPFFLHAHGRRVGCTKPLENRL